MELQTGKPLYDVVEQFPAALRLSDQTLYCSPSQDSCFKNKWR